MKENFAIDAINHIDYDLVEEYAKEKEHLKRRRENRKKMLWIKWSTIAACLGLMIICIPAIIHMTNPSQMLDSYRQGVEHKLNNINELSGKHSVKLLVQNLELTENAQIELYYNEGGSAENAEDWYSLIIGDAIYNESETVIIGGDEVNRIEKKLLLYCFFDGRTVDDQKVDMVFTKDAAETVDIYGTKVQIARHSVSLDYEYWYYAVFEYNGVVYDLRTKSNHEEYIFEVLEQLLEIE